MSHRASAAGGVARRWAALAVIAVLSVSPVLFVGTVAHAATASMSIQKSAAVTTVEPGQSFDYTIQFQCTAGTVNGCVNAVITDPLPEYLSLNGSPTISGPTSDPVIDEGPPITVTFNDDLGNGDVGLAPGNVIVLTIPVVVDQDTPPSVSGEPIDNTATITADNADTKTDTATVTPDVEPTFGAETTKVIDPEGAPAVPGTPLTAALTGTNTSNVPVDTLVIQDPVDPDASPSPFEYLGVTGLGEVTMPDGAETVQVFAYVDGTWVAGPVGPPAALPPNPPTDLADITGLRWVFTSTDGDDIPTGATADVGVELEQRENVTELTEPISISNDANTSVSVDGADPTTSEPASDTYRIPPTALDIAAGKSFDPDTVHAGDPSVVTLSGTNNSEVPLESMTITEPAEGTPNPFVDGGLTFDGIGNDAAGAGIVWPDGTTAAHITYTGPGCPGTPQDTTEPNTLPQPPDGCAPTAFTVTFDGPINPGAEATIPFQVTTAADQDVDELTRDNTVGVSGTANEVDASDDATDSITSIVDRLAIDTGKRIVPEEIPSHAGQMVIVELGARIEPFPASTVDATQIIVQDPDSFDDDVWYDSFDPQAVTATPVPGCSTLTVQYTEDGTTWSDIPGMVDIPPGIFNGVIPPDISAAAVGIRFVYTADPAGGECSGGFPPGTAVQPNLSFALEDDEAGSDATITDCAKSSASVEELSADSAEACDEVVLIPPDPGTIDAIDKAWDAELANARSQAVVGATLSWSTNNFTGMQRVDVSDTADPGTTALTGSVYDTWDLVRIDPITPELDPLLTYDQVTQVELFQLPAGSTDPAEGSWVVPDDDPCPEACDGTFPGYELSAGQRDVIIGFRLTYIESPTREQRLGSPEAPPIGSGVAASTGNNRHIHPVFQLRDELRSNVNVPVTADRIYNTGAAGEINNTVRVTAYSEVDGTDPSYTGTDADIINLLDVPVTVDGTKTWAGGPLGIPEAGVPQDEYPTARVTLTGSNTTPAKVDQLTIEDPTAGTDPFDAFNLVGFTAITPPADIGADDVTIELTPGPGGTTTYTRDQALALTESQLIDVTSFTVTYTGRIDAASDSGTPTATIGFDTRLRMESRSTVTPPADGQTVDDTMTVTAADLVGYPDVEPRTAPADRSADIDLVAQDIRVDAEKSFDPASITEPSTGPVTARISGQPSGPSRTVEMLLRDEAGTFWNAYDLVSLDPIAFTAPIEQVRVDALTGATWSLDEDGNPTLTGGTWNEGATGTEAVLPDGVAPDQVQGLRFTFTKADGGNWENPANPLQLVTFQVQRRDTLNTGGPVLPDLEQNPPAPGEDAPGITTNVVTADVTSSDVDANGDPLTATNDATAAITYAHATNAVAVTKSPNNETLPPGSPFTYTLNVTNDGDVDILDPVVTDQLPTDAQGAQVELADEPDFTYAISPDGATGMPTDPGEVTLTQTDAQLVFTFPNGSTLPVGATYTITFRMQTRPGLAAGTEFTNTFGVTGDRPWDACDGTLDPESGECRASATNTVISAGAVSVRKAVMGEGSDELGVLVDPLVTSDPTCEPFVDEFYLRPCVPVAEPGGDVTWRLRYQNTGNRPLDRILGIDRLPAPDDAVATAPGLARGSQWQPLLTGGRPELVEADVGEFNLYYTTAGADAWCDGPGGTDGALLCPELDWQEWPQGQTLSVDPATVTGLQMEILPENTLAPAAFIDVDVFMVAPPYSPADAPNTTAPADIDTMAFNSVGSTARWILDDQSTGYTLTTEPPRVGVALANGPLRFAKTVEGAGSSFAPETFALTVDCLSAGQEVPLGDAANLTLTAGEPVTVYDLPYHAECTTTEQDNGQTSSTSTTAVVQQDLADVETVTRTNVYDLASLAITKSVESSDADADGNPIPYGPFEVGVDCTFLGDPVFAEGYGPRNPMAEEISDDEVVTFSGLPARAECTVTESDAKGATSTSIVTTVGGGDPVTSDGTTSDPIELAADADGATANTAVITNQFAVGPIDILKKVTGDDAETYGDGPFTVHLRCELSDATGDRTVWDDDIVLGGDEPLEATVDNLAAGSLCTLTEPDDGGASTVSIAPEEPVLIVPDGEETATVTVTNAFDPAQLLIDKAVTGGGGDYAAASFEVEVTCSADGEVLPDFPVAVTVVPGTPTVVDTLAGATCSATETDTGQATEITYEPAGNDSAEGSGDVEVTEEGPNTISVTNEYRVGALQIVKQLDGPGGAMAAGPFIFGVSCAFNGVDDAFTDTVTLTRSGDDRTLSSEPITGLPVGAVCTVTETDSGGADSTPPPVVVTIPDVDDGAVQVIAAGFVNPYSATGLQVAKVLTGDAAADHAQQVFVIQVNCALTVSGEDIEVFSGAVQVTGGQTVPVTTESGDPLLLLAGTACYGTETDDGGADSAVVDFNSPANAVVAAVVPAGEEMPVLTITATNTFATTSETPSPTTGSAPAPPTTGPTPPPPTGGPPVTPPDDGNVAAPTQPLPNTGYPASDLLSAGLMLLAAGIVLYVGARRRSHE